MASEKHDDGSREAAKGVAAMTLTPLERAAVEWESLRTAAILRGVADRYEGPDYHHARERFDAATECLVQAVRERLAAKEDSP